MDVSVIIVAYNSAAHLPGSIASVRAQEGVAFETLVIDNASSDNTLVVLRELAAQVRVIRNNENAGFGRACNLGFEQSHGRYCYFLNPDARLIEARVLAELCRAMDQHPQWGLAGSRVTDENGELKLSATSYPDERHLRRPLPDLPGKIAWVVGASMIVRRNIFAQLGGFDPQFFLYGEETDLCLRARQSGYEIGYVDSVGVRHIGGASEQGKDPYEVWTRRAKGLLQFWRKHYSAEDVKRLVRRNRARAGYRLVVNGLLTRLSPSGTKAWNKYRRYQAVWDVSSEFSSKK